MPTSSNGKRDFRSNGAPCRVIGSSKQQCNLGQRSVRKSNTAKRLFDIACLDVSVKKSSSHSLYLALRLILRRANERVRRAPMRHVGPTPTELPCSRSDLTGHLAHSAFEAEVEVGARCVRQADSILASDGC